MTDTACFFICKLRIMSTGPLRGLSVKGFLMWSAGHTKAQEKYTLLPRVECKTGGGVFSGQASLCALLVDISFGKGFPTMNPPEMAIILQALPAEASSMHLAKRGFSRYKHKQALGSSLRNHPLWRCDLKSHSTLGLLLWGWNQGKCSYSRNILWGPWVNEYLTSFGNTHILLGWCGCCLQKACVECNCN